ncbi:hypothetical protein V6N13_093131 [Hibiscus sabdariffa]|uniref:Uncharacterized protein n=2 Tax=Hibiscus sabdariffa TaxID=183260 RepID=A0ABR2BBL9_9ROSI
MKDRLEKPQSELELLQEHMKNKMAKWDNERSSFSHLRVTELKEAYHGLEAQLNTTNILLNMDERELVHPLCHAGEWIRDHVNTMERNKAWTKKIIIHVLMLAHQTEKLEPFLSTLKTEEEHQTKKPLKNIMDLGNGARKFL